MDKRPQIAIDEQKVRQGMASKIGSLTLDNEVLISAITLLQETNASLEMENASLKIRIRDIESELATMVAEPVPVEIEPREATIDDPVTDSGSSAAQRSD